MNLTRRLAPVVLASFVGCATIQPIAYTPAPARISDPVAEVKSILLANTVGGCIAQPSFQAKMLVVQFACTGQGVGNAVARLDHVKEIVLEQSGDWYRVKLIHSNGADDFDWTSKSLDDMQRLADALTALSQGASKPAAPAADTKRL